MPPKPAPEERILSALQNPQYEWRTVSGVAKEAQVDASAVESFLKQSGDTIVSSKDRDGRRLFTTKAHYERKSSGWKKFLSGAAGRPK